MTDDDWYIIALKCNINLIVNIVNSLEIHRNVIFINLEDYDFSVIIELLELSTYEMCNSNIYSVLSIFERPLKYTRT